MAREPSDGFVAPHHCLSQSAKLHHDLFEPLKAFGIWRLMKQPVIDFR
jgi:hypothetical protein